MDLERSESTWLAQESTLVSGGGSGRWNRIVLQPTFDLESISIAFASLAFQF